MKAAVLLLYLATGSASTGMATTSAEFASLEACEAAGRRAKATFESWATSVRFVCSEKGELRPRCADVVPHSRTGVPAFLRGEPCGATLVLPMELRFEQPLLLEGGVRVVLDGRRVMLGVAEIAGAEVRTATQSLAPADARTIADLLRIYADAAERAW